MGIILQPFGVFSANSLLSDLILSHLQPTVYLYLNKYKKKIIAMDASEFVNKMGANKGLGLGMKLLAGVGLVGYGLTNSMFTGNTIILLSFSFSCLTRF